MDQQNKRKYAGIIVRENGMYYFRSKNGEIFNLVQNEETKRLCENGDLCLFELAEMKNTNEFYFGRVIEVLGKSGDPIPEGRAIAKSYNLLRDPSNAVLSEVDRIPTVVPENMKEGITDLRDIPFVTIDPDTAKDFDDAVYATKNSDGTYTLMVAIANVAAFVKPESALFDYAMKNGNSAYLGDTCYPMLLEKLSNGICSLNEGVDRLVFCTTCTMKPNGELTNYRIEPAIINSNHRLTYKEADFLYFGENADGDTKDHSEIIEKTQDVNNSLSCLYDVANILYKARMNRGAFDIDTKKLKFKLDSDGINVTSYEKDHDEQFTSVIEETAILHNEIWGEVAENFHIPFFYRNHKQIDSERMSELRGRLKQYNIELPKHATSKTLQNIINHVRGKRIEEYITSSILKSMEAAYYDIDNIGHAGLAITANEFKSFQQLLKDREMTRSDLIDEARRNFFKETGRTNGLCFEGDITHSAYAQSTSPIRRGSDLVDQMQMQEFITTGSFLFKSRDLIEHANSLNFSERNADMAEKEYDDMLSARWASNNLGKMFFDCTIVALGENEATVMTQDGYRMSLPYGQFGTRKKHLKIGSRIEKVAIDKVSICPPKVTCTRNFYLENNKTDNEMENC